MHVLITPSLLPLYLSLLSLISGSSREGAGCSYTLDPRPVLLYQEGGPLQQYAAPGRDGRGVC